jgi:hypothetical protein
VRWLRGRRRARQLGSCAPKGERKKAVSRARAVQTTRTKTRTSEPIGADRQTAKQPGKTGQNRTDRWTDEAGEDMMWKSRQETTMGISGGEGWMSIRTQKYYEAALAGSFREARRRSRSLECAKARRMGVSEAKRVGGRVKNNKGVTPVSSSQKIPSLLLGSLSLSCEAAP